ncbi:MAG: winged helix-turn-helix transcriptional regulator [Afipia felis]|nr:winged helix-turn-helix transcriptional regulator [Afipia felis]
MEDQAGFLMRLASQRHASIFGARMVGRLTPTQFAALIKLYNVQQCSQNQLGRLTAMDAPTIKGVIDRLSKRGLVEIVIDENDRRRRSISLSRQGRDLIEKALPVAAQITKLTLAPLPPREQSEFLRMLKAVGKPGVYG